MCAKLLTCLCSLSVKAHLRYGNYGSRLVHFEAQKYIFYVKKAQA
jgi:hypothetical protein